MDSGAQTELSSILCSSQPPFGLVTEKKIAAGQGKPRQPAVMFLTCATDTDIPQASPEK